MIEVCEIEIVGQMNERLGFKLFEEVHVFNSFCRSWRRIE